MLIFHTHLLLRNLTTKEFLDEKYETVSGNPYQKTNCIKNLLKIYFNATRREVKYRYYQYSVPESNDITSSSEGKLETSKKES